MRGNALLHIAGDTVQKALASSSLEFADGWNYEILAVEIRNALAPTIPPETVDPARLSNAEIRDRIAKISKSAKALDNEISGLSSMVDGRLMSESVRHDGFANFIGFIFSKDSRYFRFHEISSNLSFIADFLDSAAGNVERQASKWRQSEQRRLRVWRGERLIPVFENAFGRKITLNGWPSDPRHHAATPFMDFYQRVTKLAFGEEITGDLSGVLKEARKSVNVRICATPLPGE